MKTPGWLSTWWRRRRLRVAMHQIGEMNAEFRRDLGLDGTMIDDLIALEADAESTRSRQAVLSADSPASGPCAAGTTS